MATARPTAGRSLSPAHLLAFAALVGIFAFVNTHPIRPHDFWWHLAAGREIVRTGRIPETDTFSYTRRGAPYPSYAMFWLAEVGFYGLYTAGGPPLVIFAHSLWITAAYGLVLWTAWIRGGARAAAVGTLWAAALGLDDWNVRPQAFAFLAGALFLRALVGLEGAAGGRWLPAFPLGMALWVNTHGSFPVGLAWLGLSWLGQIGEARRPGASNPALRTRLGLAFGLALLATLLNPRGPGVYGYVLAMARNPVLRTLVPEWAPPGLDRHGLMFFAGLIFLAGALWRSPRRVTVPEALLLAGFAVLALWTSRGIVWFGMVGAPILAAHLGARPLFAARAAPGISKLNRAFLGLLGGMALASLPWFKPAWPLPPAKAGWLSAETPVAATAFLLRERPPGPLFHALSFGSYLIWAAQPDYPVFVDPRLELYPMDLWLDYLAISAAVPDWEERLDRYGIRLLMLSPAEQPALVEAAGRSPRWRLRYRDAAAVVFTRTSPSQ